MSEYIGSDFAQLAERHSQAVADLNALRLQAIKQPCSEAHGALAEAIAREKNIRGILIAWTPTSNDQAQFKLLYLVQYLLATKSSLDGQEMTAIEKSISHLKNHSDLEALPSKTMQ